MLFRFGPPLAANPRMEDPLKRAFFGRVGEYYRSKFRSIQGSIAWKYLAAEFFSNLLFHLRKLNESVRRLVGIEKFRCGKNLAQTSAKCAFTSANSTGDSDRRHKRQAAECSEDEQLCDV